MDLTIKTEDRPIGLIHPATRAVLYFSEQHAEKMLRIKYQDGKKWKPAESPSRKDAISKRAANQGKATRADES